MTRPAAFHQADLTRLLKSAAAAGLQVVRMELEPNRVVVLAAGDPAALQEAGETNEWDQVLDDPEAQAAAAR
jgi:hypothetical protein